MAVALADSVFLSVGPGEARPRVLAFLLLSFAPFIVVGRFIGPFIDGIRGGQRTVIFGVALMRAVCMIGMVTTIKSFSVFPVAFAALVLSKTYAISKSAVVPLIEPDDERLVEMNSRLGKIANLTGIVVGIPCYLLQMLSTSFVLYAGAVVFCLAAFQAWHLPRLHTVPAADARAEYDELHSAVVTHAANTMRFLRGASGFMGFHLAFWLRGEVAGTAWFAASLALGTLATLAANFAAPALRRRVRNDTMLMLSLVAVALAGIAAGLSGIFVTGILLTAVVNAAAALGRVAFEATVQGGAPDAEKGSAFARFETHNQLAWVAGGLVPVVLRLSGPAGSWCVGLLGAAGLAILLRDRRATASRAGRATARVPRPRSGSGDSPAT